MRPSLLLTAALAALSPLAGAQSFEAYEYLGEPDDQAGFTVADVGDVDGDGFADHAFGSPGHDAGGSTNIGRVRVHSGRTGALLREHLGQEPYDAFGYSVDVVGDLDGDGANELVVGAPDEDVIATDIGRGYVLDGASGALLFSRLGFWANGKLGYDVAGVGDVNGDGVPDVGFGAPFAATNGASSGSVLVVSGKAPHPALGEIAGPAGVRTGESLCGLGDADGDGRDDFAVGMPRAGVFGLQNLGWVYLVSGATLTPFTTLVGEDEHGLFGQSLDGLGDLNGDGFGDLIAAAPYDGDGGKVRVLLGEFPTPDVYCTAKINSQGCLPGIDWQGAPSFTVGGGFTITADKIVSDVVGVLIWSQAPGSTPFGGGTLCLSGSVVRTSGQFSGSQQGAPCTGGFAFEFGPAYMAGQGVLAGTDVYAQYWSRDPGFVVPNNINLTDALHFEVRP